MAVVLEKAETGGSASNTVTNSNTYTVKEGDTLSNILQDNLGNGTREFYTEFAKNNGIDNPDLIYPGQEINLGNTSTNTSTESSTSSSTSTGSNSSSSNSTSSSSGTSSNNGSSTSSSSSTSTSSNNETGDIILDSAEEKELLTSTNLDSSHIKDDTTTSSSSSTSSSNNNTSSKTTTSSTSSTSSNNAKTSTTAATSSSTSSSATSSSSSSATYANSTYTICNPKSVKGWTPLNSFKTFQIKENAGEEFVAVDQLIKKCSSDIDGIKASLNKLKNTMGDNTGTTTQIDKVVSELEEKKQDLITKEKELIEACNQVVQYVYENKASKSQEAAQVAQTIAGIQI